MAAAPAPSTYRTTCGYTAYTSKNQLLAAVTLDGGLSVRKENTEMPHVDPDNAVGEVYEMV
jgi:hypothetical protein